MSDIEDGRVPDGTRLSSSTEPQEGLRPAGFDPSRGMIERVARALATSEGCQWDDGTDGWRYYFNDTQREQYRKHARAAINAMREPTAAMVEAAGMSRACLPSEFEEAVFYPAVAWRAMIDAALPSDSDGSPKGGDACGSVHESAGLQGIAHTEDRSSLKDGGGNAGR